MEGLDGTHAVRWSLAPFLGFDHPFLILNHETIIFTWVVIALLIVICLPVRWILRKPNSIVCYTVVSGVRFFLESTRQTLSAFSFGHFCFIATIFIFITGCNIVSMLPNITPDIPWLKEPTTDLNTTIALGLISFFYTQAVSIKTRGLFQYIKGYFSPFFLMLPLNIIGKLASIVSLSFRLFGNIFGGAIITDLHFGLLEKSVVFQVLGIASGFNLVLKLFFGLFEGCLQAFVFTMLTLTYLSIALQTDEGGN